MDSPRSRTSSRVKLNVASLGGGSPAKDLGSRSFNLWRLPLMRPRKCHHVAIGVCPRRYNGVAVGVKHLTTVAIIIRVSHT